MATRTGAAFITGGTVAGAGVSATVGGMGLAGGFGAVGIGATSVIAGGAVVGAAAYGAIAKGSAAWGAVGIGAVGGAGVAHVVGGMGLVAPKIGLAVGIGTIPMMAAGGVVGLAAYGIAKMLDESGTGETPMQVFERMEEKVLEMEAYTAAMFELDLFLSGEDLNQKFAALKLEDDLQTLKDELHSSDPIADELQDLKNEIISASPSAATWKCIQTIKSHTAGVNAIAIHPDNRTFVSGSDDRTINYHDLHTGKILYTFVGQAEAVLSVAISPDGKILASGSVDRTITSWQLDTKAFLNTFSYLNSPYSHNGFVCAVTFSPNGKYIASGSSDNSIRLWSGYTRKINRTLNGHSEAVLSVIFSPDSKTLVSGSADRTIRIWNLIDFKPQILRGHLAAVTTVIISPDGQTLISGSSDRTIKLWNLSNGELLRTLTGHSTGVTSVSISPDGQTLASSSRDDTIIWHLPTGKILQNISGSPVAFTPDGQIVSGSKNGIKIWRQLVNNQSPDDDFLFKEWWEIFNVDPTAHPHDVKRAYHKVASKYHPDIDNSVNALRRMQAINRAYQQFRQMYKN